MRNDKNPGAAAALRRAGALLASALLLGACAAPAPLVQGPVLARPAPQPLYLERPSNGAIYQPHMAAGSLFSGERRPQAIGDTLKVDVSESFKAAQKQSTETGRDSKLAVKGPGAGRKSSGLLESLWNADASASGSDEFKGGGSTESSSSFNAQIAVSVINVMPNGHLLVAGERSTRLNGGATTLRFSGLVDPRDIQPGNVVSSAQVVNAMLESVAQGDVSEAASRNWVQRVLARSLAVW